MATVTTDIQRVGTIGIKATMRTLGIVASAVQVNSASSGTEVGTRVQWFTDYNGCKGTRVQ